MNLLLKKWKNQQSTKLDHQPDGIIIDGEYRVMAQRKKPQTEHVSDSSEADNTDRRVCHLSRSDFNSFIRFIRNGSVESIKQVRTETFNALKRLGVKRDLTKAPTKTPNGSDQSDVGTLIKFLRGIEPTSETAIIQLIVLDAAACQRTT